jgi:uncharacterized protein YggT (Ycf19 family)
MPTVYESQYEERPTGWYRASQVVWYLLYLLEGLLTIRFALRAIGANAAAPFTRFLYTLTAPLVAPFNSIIRSYRVNNSVLEWSTLLAMAVFWFAAWALIRLFSVADTDETMTDRYYNADRNITYDNSVERFEREPLGSARPDYFDDDTAYYNDYSIRRQQPRL